MKTFATTNCNIPHCKQPNQYFNIISCFHVYWINFVIFFAIIDVWIRLEIEEYKVPKTAAIEATAQLIFMAENLER